MALADLTIGSSDFIDFALQDFGTSLTLNRYTGTVDFRGTEHGTFGAGVSIDAVFHMREKTRVRTPEGVVELAPAYLMSKVSDDVRRGDKITLATGSSWKVWAPINRREIFVYSDLYAWED